MGLSVNCFIRSVLLDHLSFSKCSKKLDVKEVDDLENNF